MYVNSIYLLNVYIDLEFCCVLNLYVLFVIMWSVKKFFCVNYFYLNIFIICIYVDII